MMFLTKVATDLPYSCGGDLEFSGTIPKVVSTIVTIIKIAVPILLIIFGMLDLGKAVMASKEDEIKKGQQTFMKRIVAAVIVFFVVQLTQIIFKFVSGNDSTITRCLNCFVNGEEGPNACEVTGVAEE